MPSLPTAAQTTVTTSAAGGGALLFRLSVNCYEHYFNTNVVGVLLRCRGGWSWHHERRQGGPRRLTEPSPAFAERTSAAMAMLLAFEKARYGARVQR